MTTITWTIAQLDRSLPDGTILTAHWRCTGTDGAFTGSVYGTQSFPTKDPADPTFVPYDHITQATALAWVHQAMGPEQVTAHEANVQQQLAAQANPTGASGTPWTI